MKEYTLENENIVAKVTNIGAELTSIKTPDGTEYLWQGDEKYWAGRAPNLFPYVGRLVDGRYKVYGKEYELKIHGFAKRVEYKVSVATKTYIEFVLVDNEETLSAYPFKFRFCVSYELSGSKIIVRYQVRNLDEKTMYFGIGAHPGFNVPLEDGYAFEDYSLSFDEPSNPRRVDFTPTCFVTGTYSDYRLKNGRRIDLKHDLFDDDAVVLKDMPKTVTLESKGAKKVRVNYPDMDYLGIWHAVKKDAPYVCIEPWKSLPAKAGKIADLESQENLVKLEPSDDYKNEWSIEII